MPFGNQLGQVRFEEVTSAAGILRQGQTWGITLYDFNNDGLVDIYQNNHQQKPIALYLNQGDGTFVDIANQVLPLGAPGDFHGAIGLDYDNDGQQELFQVAGGDLGAALDNANKNNRFFVRQNNQLVDQSATLGLQYPLGRGRMPLPFDFNNDGKLDIVYTGPARPDGLSIPTIFLQDQTGFTNLATNSGLSTSVPNGTFAVLGDLNGDRRQELIYLANNPKIKIYDTATLPLQEITASLLPSTLLRGLNNIKDIAVADFNGDTFQDLFITQQGTGVLGYRLDSSHQGRAKLPIKRNSRGLTFGNAGALSLNFDRDPSLQLPTFFLNRTVNPGNIFIGSSRYNPDNLVFNLDPLLSENQGLPSFTPGVDRGVFIGFDVAKNQWSVRVSSPRSDEFYFLFETETLNPTIQTQGFKQNLNGLPDKLLTYDPALGQFVDSTSAAGLSNTKIAGRNVVAEDFDNDGDRDLFIVATANTVNLPDELFENLGDGTFQRVANAAGAAGTRLGIGDAVAVADYDVDGFLDLFVTNGDVTGFDRPFWLDGTNQLFRNQGNDNHWIQIDLEGTVSNRDAVGATVYVTTPDGKRQIREQNAGVHNRVQNFSRLHFGLGDQTLISTIEVYWPNGESQVFDAVAVDQVIQIQENSPTITPLFSAPPPTTGLRLLPSATSEDQGDAAVDDELLRAAPNQRKLKGYRGNDTLVGNQDDNVLVGGKGDDLLTGSQGRDHFTYYAANHGRDRITDFVSQADQIVVSPSGFEGLTSGTLRQEQFVLGSKAVDRQDRFIYDQASGQLWFDPDGLGRKSAFLLAELQNNPTLQASDIQVM